MENKKELNYMNAIACLAVILIHVLSYGIANADRTSWQAAVIYFPWRLAAFAVPMFLYTGAVKMAMQFGGEQPLSLSVYARYVLRRIQKVFLPYVLWCAIYYLYFLSIHWVKGDAGEFLSYLFQGNLSSPFYYVILVMQYYLLLPLWRWMLLRVPAYVGIPLSLFITQLAKQSAVLLPYIGSDFAFADRIVPNYLVFWCVGLYVGQHYACVKRMLQNRSALLLSLIGAIAVVCFDYLIYAGRLSGLYMQDAKIVGDVLSIAALHTIGILLCDAPHAIQAVCSYIYKCSFLVYLSHCLFLTQITNEITGRGITDLSSVILLRFAVCYTLPFLLCALWDRVSRFCGRILPITSHSNLK